MEHIKHAEKPAEPRVFEDLNLSHNVLRAVKELGFSELTPIQQKCIPLIQQGKDVEMTIKLEGYTEHMAYQADNRFTIEVRPLTDEQKEMRRSFRENIFIYL